MSFPLVPLLSEEDRVEGSEGALDPLGLNPIAEALAVELVPGVRERMSNPRYLTAMAVGMEVCRTFGEDQVAKDGVTPPWMAYEWIVVEALARTASRQSGYRLPGSEKAAAAVAQGVGLSAARYLKSPFVFGFHGVYRGLARDLQVESGGRLGDFGYELLTTWTDEQGLAGFTGSQGGPGSEWCHLLRAAVRESLAIGAVARKNGWQGWGFVRDHLAPDGMGTRERNLLRRALFSPTAGHRAEVLRALTAPEALAIYDETESERAFHGLLRSRASEELGIRLDAISLYERFARLCQRAFDDVLHALTRHQGQRLSPVQLAALESVGIATREVPALFGELRDRLEPRKQAGRFVDSFEKLGEVVPVSDWVHRLLDHHLRIQLQKPPAGKSPWFERFDDGSVIVRPLYRRAEPAFAGEEYVHLYRTRPLRSFAADLQLLPA